jgi:DNA polymerase-3 subunit beta
MKIYAQLNALQAIALFADKKEIRPQLRGVYIEATKTQTRIVATNGHIMGLYDCKELPENEIAESDSVHIILPLDSIKSLKAVRQSNIVEINLTDRNSGTLSYANTSVGFTGIDAVFPDYCRVIPKTLTGENCGFNSVYFPVFQKAINLIGCEVIKILHNGGGAALVKTENSRFLGVFMPMRSDIKTDEKTYDGSFFCNRLLVANSETLAA